MMNIKEKYYTGVGSRETPLFIYILMIKISMILEKQGFILRSGTAKGADSAFEQGVSNAKMAEIFIPHRGFEKKMGKHNSIFNYVVPKENKKLFYEANNIMMNQNLYKRWKKVRSPWVIELHNRNIFQVLGVDLKTKSNFTICYTGCGSTTYEQTNPDLSGGTGTAINVSDRYHVPVFNLKKSDDLMRLIEFVEKHNDLVNYNKLPNIVPLSSFNDSKKTIKQLLENKILIPEEEVDFKIIKNILKPTQKRKSTFQQTP